jgi:hypothetical protein
MFLVPGGVVMIMIAKINVTEKITLDNVEVLGD